MQKSSASQKDNQDGQKGIGISIPSLSLPKGGGALKAMDEKFSVNAVNGSASFSIPIPLPASRGMNPSLTAAYNSGSGHGLMGLGWNLEAPSIRRKTDKRLPDYGSEDAFLFSGAEDLVPALRQQGGGWVADAETAPSGEKVTRYVPRIQGDFSRIECILRVGETVPYWKVTTPDNTVTFFGRSEASRVHAPGKPEQVAIWLPDLSYDDKGNCAEYFYRDEDLVNVPHEVHERNRLNGLQGVAQKYLKQLSWGNEHPYYPDAAKPYDPAGPVNPGYFFNAVIDYGDHAGAAPAFIPYTPWPARRDPHSDYRYGFEMRTWRIVHRVLVFHTFKELSPTGIVEPTLTKAMQFGYRHTPTGAGLLEANYLEKAWLVHFRRKPGGGYDSKAMPPSLFSYQEPVWDPTLHTVDAESISNMPAGFTGKYVLTDLRNEGLPGMLTEQGDQWFFKRNLGNGNLGSLQLVASRPSLGGLAEGTLTLTDIEGDGRKFLVFLSRGKQGYWELRHDEWLPFRTFDKQLNVSATGKGTRMIDLNGDGRPDLLLQEELAFTWLENQGTQGYGEQRKMPLHTEEEEGPIHLFSDASEAIYLADMSGDGLTDVVSIRNGEVCYWPNLGHGRFGARVCMANAPLIDTPDQFDPSLIHLADLSGTGATDLLYLGGTTPLAWTNLGGNGWSAPMPVEGFPTTGKPTQVQVIDFLGKGTASIVWSSPLPDHNSAPLRYLDPYAGVKPFILSGIQNSYGAKRQFTYKSSTQFYLEDEAAGKPWVTRLPYPVQCVDKVVTEDEVTGHRFTSRYCYHHGYFDFPEREFRGFGCVEQWDTEEFHEFAKSGANNIVDKVHHQDPVLVRTWFHTGAFLDRERIMDQFAHEYYQNLAMPEHQIPQPDLSTLTDPIEWREALRACKGTQLRQETYMLDGTAAEKIPVSVVEHGCHIERLQPRQGNHSAVFLQKESETVTYHYERNAADPRIAHEVNIDFDNMGKVLLSANIVYGRKVADMTLPQEVRDAQGRIRILVSVQDYTTDVKTHGSHRLRMPWNSHSWELSGVVPATAFFNPAEVKSKFNAAALKHYHQQPTWAGPEKRKVKHTRIVHLADDGVTPLAPGTHASLGLTHQTYQLALTEAVRQNAFDSKVDPALLKTAGYLLSADLKAAGTFPNTDPDDDWWVSSGTQVYPANPKQHFFRPVKYVDALLSETSVLEWGSYHLFLAKTTDALGNESTILEMDFRTLQPIRFEDMNGTVSSVAIDLLGMVAGTAIMGKLGEGDNLTGFVADLSDADLDAFLLDPAGSSATLLGNATTRIVYDLSRTRVSTVMSATLEREKHLHQMAPGDPTVTYLSFVYSDGGGHAVLTKAQAEPGKAKRLKPNNTVEEVDTSPALRWLGNGRTIFNNKGKPIKQFEPYFSVTHLYESEAALVEIGQTPVMHYDAAGRQIQADLPDGTFTRVEFSPWLSKSYDANDNVKFTSRFDPTYDPLNPESGSRWMRDRSPGGKYAGVAEKVDALAKALVHHNTPVVAHFDSLGRTICTVVTNVWTDRTTGLPAAPETLTSLSLLDIQGHVLEMRDPRGNVVMAHTYSPSEQTLVAKSMDAGSRWTLADCMGKPYARWDSKEQMQRFFHDALHRPIRLEVTPKVGAMFVARRTEYGEAHATPTNYLRGKLYRDYDGAGILTHDVFSFHGEVEHTVRQFAADHTQAPDWKVIGAVALAPEQWETTTLTDAVGKVLQSTQPDGSIVKPSYNAAKKLESLKVQVRGGVEQTFVSDIHYNEKGQRKFIHYGNGVHTTYHYEEESLRLMRLVTTRKGGAETLQDLHYFHDPVANITQIRDDAQDTVFFNGAVVKATGKFTYDSLSRLMAAEGREHIMGSQAVDAYDLPRYVVPLPGNGADMRNYRQFYEYDKAGNMTKMVHTAGNGAFVNQWTRTFEIAATNNHLLSEQLGASPAKTFDHDVHGSLTRMPHLNLLEWDFEDHLVRITRDPGNGESNFNTAWYNYDHGGQRARKTVTHANGVTEQRLYLGAVEIYTQTQAGKTLVRRESLHVMDDARRIAMVDTRTVDNDAPVNVVRQRYQLDNHLGSACMEVDETANANLISYEEYYPFGSSAYRTHNNDAEAAASRYRYTGKERDEESGLYYHGARYFAPWLARWTSADPKAEKAGLNFYQYVSSNPIRMNDPDGKDGNDTVTPRRGTTTTPREEPQPPVAPLVPRSTFDLPSLLDTRTPLQRRADSFAGTLAPTLRLPIPTAAPSPSDPAPTRTTTGVTTDFSLIPPHIMVAYRDRFIFDADTTRAVIAVRTHSDWTVQSGYQYGQDISLSYGNPLWNFRVGFKPTGDTPRGTIEINGRDSLSSPTTFLRITTDSGDAADGVMLGQIVPRAFTVGGQDFPFAWNLHVNPYRPGVGLSFGLGGPLLATPEVLRDHTNLAYGAGVRVAEDAYDLFRQHGPLPIPGIGDFISRHADPQDGRATSDFDHIGNAATDFSNIGGVRRGFDVRAGFGVSAERLPDARVDFRVNFQLQFYHF